MISALNNWLLSFLRLRLLSHFNVIISVYFESKYITINYRSTRSLLLGYPSILDLHLPIDYLTLPLSQSSGRSSAEAFTIEELICLFGTVHSEVRPIEIPVVQCSTTVMCNQLTRV